MSIVGRGGCGGGGSCDLRGGRAGAFSGSGDVYEGNTSPLPVTTPLCCGSLSTRFQVSSRCSCDEATGIGARLAPSSQAFLSFSICTRSLPVFAANSLGMGDGSSSSHAGDSGSDGTLIKTGGCDVSDAGSFSFLCAAASDQTSFPEGSRCSCGMGGAVLSCLSRAGCHGFVLDSPIERFESCAVGTGNNYECRKTSYE